MLVAITVVVHGLADQAQIPLPDRVLRHQAPSPLQVYTKTVLYTPKPQVTEPMTFAKTPHPTAGLGTDCGMSYGAAVFESGMGRSVGLCRLCSPGNHASLRSSPQGGRTTTGVHRRPSTFQNVGGRRSDSWRRSSQRSRVSPLANTAGDVEPVSAVPSRTDPARVRERQTRSNCRARGGPSGARARCPPGGVGLQLLPRTPSNEVIHM